MEDAELFKVLQREPPLPPWLAFPALEPASIGWRMGGGEDHIYKLVVYFRYCSQDEKDEYKRRYPEPPGWSGWYEDHGLQFDGVELLEIPEETIVRASLSPDRKRLFVVGRRDDGLYRVRPYHRMKDLWSTREHWMETDSPTLLESEVEALDFADSLLRSAAAER